ncbi:MAG: hypothetical protein O7E55_00655 [Chloroflexi bacterium]|nr:hypothetical protein [Chloroflexota bacterium]
MARTLLLEFIVTVHLVPLTVSQPDQPTNCQPRPGLAAKVTAVPWPYNRVVLHPWGLTAPNPLQFTVRVNAGLAVGVRGGTSLGRSLDVDVKVGVGVGVGVKVGVGVGVGVKVGVGLGVAVG